MRGHWSCFFAIRCYLADRHCFRTYSHRPLSGRLLCGDTSSCDQEEGFAGSVEVMMLWLSKPFFLLIFEVNAFCWTKIFVDFRNEYYAKWTLLIVEIDAFIFFLERILFSNFCCATCSLFWLSDDLIKIDFPKLTFFVSQRRRSLCVEGDASELVRQQKYFRPWALGGILDSCLKCILIFALL